MKLQLLSALALLSCLLAVLISFSSASTGTNSILTSGKIDASNANLLFKSSFEEPVYFEHVNEREGFLHGSDQGFEWYTMLGYTPGHMVNYNNGEIGVDVDTWITNVEAHSGSRSLYQVVYTPWSSSGYAHRVQLQFYTRYQDYPKLFVRGWHWLPPDLKLPPNGVMSGFRGHREVDPDYATELGIWRNGNGKLEWYVSSGFVPGGSQPPREWKEYNHEVEVPLGRWFKVETYVEFHRTNGIYKVWIDGKLVFDVQGKQTMNLETEVMQNRLAKIYVGHSGDEYTYPYYQYFDDVEIWDDIP